jgi:hypothetical protein
MLSYTDSMREIAKEVSTEIANNQIVDVISDAARRIQ